VTFVDSDAERIFLKSRSGLEGVSQIPLGNPSNSFCAQSILSEFLEVRDASLDERFKDSPLVTESPKIRYYAGAPLVTPNGWKLGNLCVINTKPHSIDEEQIVALKRLAGQVISQLELRLNISLLKKNTLMLEKTNEEKNKFIGKKQINI
jgi:GAF domain-containing protein